MAIGGPKVADSPLELISTPAPIEQSVLSKIWVPASAGVLGFSSVLFANYFVARPYFSGIQRHFIVTGACTALALWADKFRNEYLAERDAVIKHYVQLHPEDFPPYEKKKYAELLEPWQPIR